MESKNTGLLFLVLFVCMSACSLADYLQRVKINQNSAIARIKHIIFNQNENLLKEGKFKTDDWGNKEYEGYIIEMTNDEKSFQLWATPKKYGVTGKISFYADSNAGDIRGADHKGEKATSNDPIIEKASDEVRNTFRKNRGIQQ